MVSLRGKRYDNYSSLDVEMNEKGDDISVQDVVARIEELISSSNDFGVVLETLLEELS